MAHSLFRVNGPCSGPQTETAPFDGIASFLLELQLLKTLKLNIDSTLFSTAVKSPSMFFSEDAHDYALPVERW
jgi:hypothetical protein